MKRDSRYCQSQFDDLVILIINKVGWWRLKDRLEPAYWLLEQSGWNCLSFDRIRFKDYTDYTMYLAHVGCELTLRQPSMCIKIKSIMTKEVYHANTNQNETIMSILKSDKVDFRAKDIIRENEDHFIVTKGSINQEDVTILYI